MTTISAFISGNGNEYWFTRMLLQRSLALIYLFAFVGAVNQFRPLLGTHGLTPVPYFIERVPFWRSPSLFFAHYSDTFAMLVAWVGVIVSALAMVGVTERFGTAVSMLAWGVLWVGYLSFVNVGQTWYSFGWESLLLESGFLAIFLGGRDVAPPVIVIWMFRWLLFRLMFGAGLIKLRGDPCWRDLTCLVYHYETQPIPNPLSWYFNQLPRLMLKMGVLFNHLAELVAPFGYLIPWGPARYTAGVITIVFQATLILSGNLSWLNWLTIVIAISCFDDRFFAHFLRAHAGSLHTISVPHGIAVAALFLAVAALSIPPVLNMISPRQMMNASFEPFHLVNTYGAFGSITRKRYEIVLEGTTDSVTTSATQWQEYQFKAKPGDVRRRPPVLALYHRRLDWLMWFAAMGHDYSDPWFLPFVARLLQNDAATLSLMDSNPFPVEPPRQIRARLYLYEFATPATKRQGIWWTRTFASEYLPPISLNTPGFMDSLALQGWIP